MDCGWSCFVVCLTLFSLFLTDGSDPVLKQCCYDCCFGHFRLSSLTADRKEPTSTKDSRPFSFSGRYQRLHHVGARWLLVVKRRIPEPFSALLDSGELPGARSCPRSRTTCISRQLEARLRFERVEVRKRGPIHPPAALRDFTHRVQYLSTEA